jgi:DNA polymerase beta
MNRKTLIISNLEKLKLFYLQDNANKKFQIIALNKAISSIQSYTKEIVSGTQLKNDISGIGDKISKRIDEILDPHFSGTLKELENQDLKEDSYNELMSIYGVGNSRAKKWIEENNVRNIEDLKKEVSKGNIKITKNIETGLKYFDDLKKRIPREEIDVVKEIIQKELKKINPQLLFEICGSYRRKNDTSGDIDILISHPKYIDENNEYNFLNEILKNLRKQDLIVDDLTKNGNKKFMGICKVKPYNVARHIDILFVDYNSYYSSILYFTGSKNFNVYLRQKLLQKNMSLNEYCLKDLENNNIIYLTSEKEIFKIADIKYLEPHERNAEKYE